MMPSRGEWETRNENIPNGYEVFINAECISYGDLLYSMITKWCCAISQFIKVLNLKGSKWDTRKYQEVLSVSSTLF